MHPVTVVWKAFSAARDEQTSFLSRLMQGQQGFPPPSLDDSPWKPRRACSSWLPCAVLPTPGSRDPSSKALCGRKHLSRENPAPKKENKQINELAAQNTAQPSLPQLLKSYWPRHPRKTNTAWPTEGWQGLQSASTWYGPIQGRWAGVEVLEMV